MLSPISLIAAGTLAGAASIAAQQTAPVASETCIAGARKVSHSSHSSRNSRHEIEWRVDGCEVVIRFDGQPRFTDDFRSLESLSSGDRFDVHEESGRVTRSVEVRPRSGSLEFRYAVNGERRDFDAEGRRWFDSVIRQFFLRTAYASKERVAWLARNGGADRVLAEIEQMPTTYPQHAYMVALVDEVAPTRGTIDRMLQRVREWSSDYYKAGLLTHIVTRGTLDAPGWAAIWGVAETIDSDYYTSRVVRASMDAGAPMKVEQFERVLQRVESDYYRAGLVDVAGGRLGGQYGPLVLAAARETRSPYYRTEILSRYLRNASPDNQALVDVIRLAGELDSDYYRAQLLRQVARRGQLVGMAREAYVGVAEAIGSRYYRQQALAAIGLERPRR
jgi:hypothetical protein